MPFKVKFNLNIAQTEARKLQVYEALSSGSDPRGSFFLLVGVSTLIAAFGLIMNSTAVVIGAMLVAPLMTPILGLALALVRGDIHLFGISLRSEAMGVIVAIVAGRLRRALEHYYLTAGANDRLRIEVPKGGYVPEFRLVDAVLEGLKKAGLQ